jgi:hypothetical protein
MLLVVFGGVLYAGLGWGIGYLADCVRSKGVRVLIWCVGVSAATLTSVALAQEWRFAAAQQKESSLDAPDGFRSRCTGRWQWSSSIASTIRAAESEKAVVQALRNLDEQDGAIRRYGRLVSSRCVFEMPLRRKVGNIEEGTVRVEWIVKLTDFGTDATSKLPNEK